MYLSKSVAERLRGFIAERSAASGVSVLEACASKGGALAAECTGALATWLQVEQELADEAARASEAAMASEGPYSIRLTGVKVPVLLWFVTVLCVLGWRWLIWLAVSLAVICVRVLAACYQCVRLALSLALFAAAALLRTTIAAVSRFGSTRRLNDLDATLKAGAAVGSGVSYEEWVKTAEARDELSGAAAWRASPHEAEDEWAVHESLLKEAEEEGARSLRFALQPLMKGNGISEPAVAMAGVRHATARHTGALAAALAKLAAAPSHELEPAEKLSFFASAQLALGHTALCLSGGGSLAMYHMGVVRSLLEAGLLPRVISGTSGGSIVAGFLAQRTDQELLDEVLVPHVSTCFEERWFPPLHEQVAHFLREGVLVRSEDFERTTRAYYGSLTFEESFRRTGRHVNISICATSRGGGRQSSVLLNHVTTPNVLVHSAVACSCALPGIMKPATLLAKDAEGRIVPMDPPGTKWVDGTMRADLPMQRLSQLFHVSQFIVSQVNPHIAPFVEGAQAKLQRSGSGVAASLTQLQRHLMRDVQQRYRALASLHMLPTFFGEDARHLMHQQYHGRTGDVTVVPKIEMRDFFHAIMNPTVADMRRYLSEGRLRTWEKLAAIRRMLEVERALEAGRAAAQARARRVPAASVPPWPPLWPPLCGPRRVASAVNHRRRDRRRALRAGRGRRVGRSREPHEADRYGWQRRWRRRWRWRRSWERRGSVFERRRLRQWRWRRWR